MKGDMLLVNLCCVVDKVRLFPLQFPLTCRAVPEVISIRVLWLTKMTTKLQVLELLDASGNFATLC